MIKEVWFQAHDFTSKDVDAPGSAEALEYLGNVNWPAQWQGEAQKMAAGDECCAAGMGFRAEDESFLHVMSTPEGTIVLFQWKEPVRILGLFSSIKTRDQWAEKFLFGDLPALLENFYAADYAVVRRLLAS